MSILKSAAVVSVMTMISRVAGLVREILMAHYFGTSVLKSAFDVAFKIPNLFRRLFGEGALSAALIPVYTELLHKDGPEAANRLAARVAGLLVTVLGSVVALGILLTFPIQEMLPEGSRWVTILPILRIVLFYSPLICLAALIMGVLNARKSFAVSALTPVFLNVCWIFALACVCPFFKSDKELCIRIVSFFVLAAGFVQIAFQLPWLRKFGVPISLEFVWRGDAGIRRIIETMAPMALGIGIFEVNVFIDSMLAMWAAPWAPAALEYADRVIYLPLGLFGTAFATVLLPTLSEFAVKANFVEFRKTLESSFRALFALMIPASVGLTVLSAPIVAILYEGGSFEADSILRTARALIGYAPGLLVFSLYKVIVPAFYAVNDTKTPARIGIYCVFLNLCLNIIFVTSMSENWRHAGLALATVISSLVNCIALLTMLKKRDGVPRFSAVSRTLFSAIGASAVMGAVALVISGFVQAYMWESPAKLAHLMTILITITVSVLVYMGIMLCVDRSALKDALRRSRGHSRRN